jgi:RecJ-like exonuclease
MKVTIFISIISTCLILLSLTGYAGDVGFAGERNCNVCHKHHQHKKPKDIGFVGANKCKLCHGKANKGNIYEKWLKGPHAKSLDTLKARREEQNPLCVDCHTTGSTEGAIGLAGVQCESCHGRGISYATMYIMKDKKKSLANGLIEPKETVCIKCHNNKSPNFKGFNYKEAVAKINHRFRK